MTKKFALSLLLLTLWSVAFAQTKVRIACVGNSITFGSLVENREKNSYPAQLQNMLGKGYEVKNFGVSGRTLLRKGNLPYWKEKAFAEALAYRPDIVTILLGTNDSKAVNRPHLNEFESDYTDLIESFRALPSKPRIVLLLPVPSFYPDSSSIYDPVIKTQIIPRIQHVAYKNECELINLYNLFIDKPGLLVDQIHPSSIGAGIIARRLYESLYRGDQPETPVKDILSKLPAPLTYSNFYGYVCADFTFAGRACKVVKPRKAATGLPWVWRARFWGHEPQTDLALLERGFHVVYCDVTELFGNQQAIRLWNDYYALMRRCGLAKKVVLEGMSRGGVYIYNWALANPTKVACIYADAPVLDLKSWPGGKGTSAGSKVDWNTFMADYQLNEEQADNFSSSPLDKAASIARLGFPMLHVVGDADTIVPVAENTAPFAQKIQAAGGRIILIHKPGIGHHPHSLPNPDPIVDFILAATHRKINFAALPAPGNEYRSGAGWLKGKDWWAQHQNIDSLLMARKPLDILFVGNSITQGLAGHRSSVTHKPGLNAFSEVFKNYSWESAGISGDRTQNVLWRLQNGRYTEAAPRVIVVTIGVNNIPDDSPAEIVAGIRAIADYVQQHMPSSRLILTGPLPTGLQKDSDKRKCYDAIHSLLAKMKHKGYTYLPLTKAFVQPDGNLSTSDYSADGIHLVTGGYQKWAQALKPTIDHLLQRR